MLRIIFVLAVALAAVAVYKRFFSASSAAAIENINAGKEYLEENKTRQGVQVTASGLQYEQLKPGTGSSHPIASDTVTVHYHGTLIDGTVFDSSVNRGEPASFPLNRVIKGWTEGLQLMVAGEKMRFHIPADLAYGNRRTGSIPAGSVLIFDVELLSID